MAENGCPFEKGLDERKLKYSYSYHASEITFISQFLDDIRHKVNKLELVGKTLYPVDLCDLIADEIVGKFYLLDEEEVEHLAEDSLYNSFYSCIKKIVINRVLSSVFDLYLDIIDYSNLKEEEDKKPEYSEGFKHVENRVYQGLLEVFFVRNS